MAASSMLMFVTRWECMPRCVTGGARAAADSSDEDDASWHVSWAHVPMPTWDVPGAGAGAGAGAPGAAPPAAPAPAAELASQASSVPSEAPAAAHAGAAYGGDEHMGDEHAGGAWAQYTAADFAAEDAAGSQGAEWTPPLQPGGAAQDGRAAAGSAHIQFGSFGDKGEGGSPQFSAVRPMFATEPGAAPAPGELDAYAMLGALSADQAAEQISGAQPWPGTHAGGAGGSPQGGLASVANGGDHGGDHSGVPKDAARNGWEAQPAPAAAAAEEEEQSEDLEDLLAMLMT